MLALEPVTDAEIQCPLSTEELRILKRAAWWYESRPHLQGWFVVPGPLIGDGVSRRVYWKTLSKLVARGLLQTETRKGERYEWRYFRLDIRALVKFIADCTTEKD